MNETINKLMINTLLFEVLFFRLNTIAKLLIFVLDIKYLKIL